MCKRWYLVEERFVVGEQMMLQGLRRRRGGDGGHSQTITIDDGFFVDGEDVGTMELLMVIALLARRGGVIHHQLSWSRDFWP
jgi:hypothetical protein